jgi:hypothetical protein
MKKSCKTIAPGSPFLNLLSVRHGERDPRISCQCSYQTKADVPIPVEQQIDLNNIID